MNMGVIRLLNMAFYAHHGVTAAERELGQILEVDVEISLDLHRAAVSDDLSQTIDYGEIYGLVEEGVVEGEFSLLEALARVQSSGRRRGLQLIERPQRRSTGFRHAVGGAGGDGGRADHQPEPVPQPHPHLGSLRCHHHAPADRGL